MCDKNGIGGDVAPQPGSEVVAVKVTCPKDAANSLNCDRLRGYMKGHGVSYRYHHRIPMQLHITFSCNLAIPMLLFDLYLPSPYVLVCSRSFSPVFIVLFHRLLVYFISYLCFCLFIYLFILLVCFIFLFFLSVYFFSPLFFVVRVKIAIQLENVCI